MANTLAVTLRCPRHRVSLVWDAELGLWKCPATGCPYLQPGEAPAELPVEV